MRGKTRIELTDINTGQVEVVESDNMLTNALPLLLTPYMGKQSIYQENLIPDIVKGIYLFDEPLDESPDNVNLLRIENSNLVAKGSAVSTNDTDMELGTYNSAESGLVGNEYKLVFDFDSTKGNGKISCVSLTTNGAVGWGNSNEEIVSNGQKNTTTTGRTIVNSIAFFSEDRQYIYTLKENKMVDGKIILQKHINFLTHVGFSRDLILEEIEVVLPTEFAEAEGSQENLVFTPSHDGESVMLAKSGFGIASGNTKIMCKIDNAFNSVVVGLTNIDTRSHSEIIFNKKYMILASSSATSLVKYEFATELTEVITVPATSASFLILVVILIGDYLMSTTYALNLKTNVLKNYGSSKQTYLTIALNELVMCQYNYSLTYCTVLNNMPIISINNLETPIVKDETKTMKVIYTLTI